MKKYKPFVKSWRSERPEMPEVAEPHTTVQPVIVWARIKLKESGSI